MTNLASMITDLGEKFNATTGDLSIRLGEMEKRFARMPDGDNDNVAVASIGRRLIDTEAFKALNGGRARGKAMVELAAITSGNSTVGTGRSQGTSLVQAHRVDGIITPPQRQMTVRDLIAPGKTGSNSIEFVQETGFTNNAAPVAETTQKPYSDITFDLKNAPVRTIAHLFKASKQILDDADALISHIDVRARYGLEDKEERQLLFGDGTGQNLHGLIPQATEFDTGLRKVGDTRIDTLRRAILQVRKAEYRATGIVMSPDDLADLELTKDAGGNYILVINVVEGGQSRVWKLPIVDSTVMPVGEFLVGSFGIAAQCFDRQLATVEVSTENVDDFERNMCTIRAEERLALAVYRPESFVHGAFEE